MMKQLKDMTLEELWQLFPISIESHKDDWKEWAQDECGSLSMLLHDFSPVITHIGSTAIPGIMAKPIVDILVEVSAKADRSSVKTLMESSGYICMNESARHMSFNKGYTPEGYAEKVFHIHLRDFGDNAEILFRDYLIAHPKIAKEYETLKKSLLPKFRNDRDAYTEAKTEFVRYVLNLAQSE